jgi:PAS domain S-box-containing protein
VTQFTAGGPAEVSREGPRAALFYAAFEEAPDPILLADDERRYVAGNRAVRKFLGVSRDALTASRIDDYTVRAMRPELEQIWRTFMARGTLEGVFPLLLPNGLERVVLFRAKANVRPGRHLSVFHAARYDHRGMDYQDPKLGEISFREREILTLLARGTSVSDAAVEMSLAPETVRTHLRNAMRKLGAHTRPHAIALAMKHRYIDP